MRSLPRFGRWTEWVRASQVLRRTFDQLYDGVHTWRYSVDHLVKTEKTNFAALIEINLQRESRFAGEVIDLSMSGHEVDCNYAQTGARMLPLERLKGRPRHPG